MFSNNEKRRNHRLPLYVALLAALPLGGITSQAFAANAETSGEARCDASLEKDCADDTTTSSGFRASARANTNGAPIGVMGGDFSAGAGVSIALTGETATATQLQDVAIGNGASATSGFGDVNAAIAIGAGASANVSGGVAIGSNASATASGAVALGANSVGDRADTVSIGSGDATSGFTRQITYMAAGTQGTDAVNVSQLSSLVTGIGGSIDSTTGAVTMPTFTVQGDAQASVADAVKALDGAVTASNTSITNLTNNLSNGTVGLVQQAAAGADLTVASGLGGDTVDFTGTAGTRKLTGVTAGTLSATSTDAVNGAQLFTTNQNVTQNSTDITNLQTLVEELSDGDIGLVQQHPTNGTITMGADVGGNTVDFTNVDGAARNVTGVAAGDISSSTSTEAVNGGQLYDTNQAVSALDTRVSTAEGDITTIKQSLADLDAGIASGITYDDPSSKSQITLGGDAGTLVTNVANGSIASGSMDAINGGQLSALNDQLQGQIGNLSGRMDNISEGLGNVGNFDGNLDNQRITNLADGVAPTDAATVGQVKQAANNAVSTANAYTDSKFNALNNDLQNFKGEVNDRFNRLDQRVDRIGAMSAANTQMAINAGGVENTGKGRIAVGVGMQSSKAAFAVGYANKVNERVRMSLGAAFSGSEASIGAGAGFDL
jgi:trimeric autotransporter adhesin